MLMDYVCEWVQCPQTLWWQLALAPLKPPIKYIEAIADGKERSAHPAMKYKADPYKLCPMLDMLNAQVTLRPPMMAIASDSHEAGTNRGRLYLKPYTLNRNPRPLRPLTFNP